ncbi:acyltransferase family protein [Hymenobacter negativus]|uniref:Acyltransferase n=1 Tax=Hymenobacter negativus TaxID=2795026 RepID=A0ABS3Q860_9BACT|nr:acyltransferase [Hymenobacter negativus]MBO2007429.1 acyltransferase [Hymenobacter negativus]
MTPISTSSSASPSLPRRKFEFNLEALRGFAALIVVFHHAILHKLSLDPGYSPKGAWANPLSGHSSVLVFFILSGYVIGLTNTKPLTKSTILPYLRKRIVRLYPIYTISLLFALIIATHQYSLTTVLGHFLFLQNSVVPYIFENNPLWSLNYEVLYYLAFIPISYFALSPGKVCLGAAVVGVIAGIILPMPYLSAYSFGFVFWVSGLWLAQNTSFFSLRYASHWELFGLVFLFLGYEFLNPLTMAVLLLDTKLHVHFANPGGASITFSDLCQLPFCFYLFLRFTNFSFKGANVFLAAVVGLGLLYFAYIARRYGLHSSQVSYLLVPIATFLLGTACLVVGAIRPQSTEANPLPTVFIKLGAISYGVYVIHFPISIMLSRIPVFSGTAVTYCIRLLLDVVLVIAAGYLLELKIQPWFKARFSEKPSVRPLAIS